MPTREEATMNVRYRITLEPEEFTSDQKALIGILRGEMQTEGPTPLWNAANKAMAESEAEADPLSAAALAAAASPTGTASAAPSKMAMVMAALETG